MDVFPSVYNILFIDERILEYLTDLKKKTTCLIHPSTLYIFNETIIKLPIEQTFTLIV